jgi:hypothetical protein
MLTTDNFQSVTDLIVEYTDINFNLYYSKTISNAEIYSNAKTTLKISFEVTTPYTTSDTIYLLAADSSGEQIKLAGPFTSGLKFILDDFPVGTIVKNVDYVENNVTFGFKINESDTYTEEIDVNICDTSSVVLHI